MNKLEELAKALEEIPEDEEYDAMRWPTCAVATLKHLKWAQDAGFTTTPTGAPRFNEAEGVRALEAFFEIENHDVLKIFFGTEKDPKVTAAKIREVIK